MTRIFLLFLAAVSAASAQWKPNSQDVAGLTHEEWRLVQAFRSNPAPFRQILDTAPASNNAVAQEFVGPRDVIDITLTGGKVAFYGKRGSFLPASIRLARGEEAVLVIGREKSAIETRVRVAYRIDGLHFDIPEPYTNTQAQPRGFVVIPESGAWRTGEAIPWNGHVDDHRSVSKAENLVFQIRYVAR